ncbi:MAG: hypothetical protein ACRDKT_04790, partial [Actinomycetota bacterium]
GLVLGAMLAILTIIQFQGGIGEQISPLTRWLGGKRFEGHHAHKGPKREKKKGALLAKMGLHKTSEPDAATEPPESVEPGSQAKMTSEEQPDTLPAPPGAETTEMPRAADDDSPWKRPSSGGES